MYNSFYIIKYNKKVLFCKSSDEISNMWRIGVVRNNDQEKLSNWLIMINKQGNELINLIQ